MPNLGYISVDDFVAKRFRACRYFGEAMIRGGPTGS
jgi:hypothetical protein